MCLSPVLLSAGRSNRKASKALPALVAPHFILTMVSIHGYNKEKKHKGFSDVYLAAILFAVFAAFVFVGGLKFLIFLISFVVKNWVWVLVGIAAIVVVIKFVIPKGRKHEV